MINIEIKALYDRTPSTDRLLKKYGFLFDRTENQMDTYFHVNYGRLKIRERDGGDPQLIQYFRDDQKGPKQSYYEIVHLKNVEQVKSTLEEEHGILVIVKKKREIWTWQNIRIHFDCVEKLGNFIEFEIVIDTDGNIQTGQQKAEWLMKKFHLSKTDLIAQSYSDLIMDITD
ncbi:class IV adenylate cyclase [bacterium]|nr:class IV adenylate cyclase [bacterium]